MKLILELLEINDKLLLENPQQIGQLIIRRLEDPRLNQKLYKTIEFQKNKILIEKYNNNTVLLYRIDNHSDTEIYGLIPSTKEVGYYVRWEKQNAHFINVDWATQVLVWGGTNPETKGLPEYVFYKYVINETGAVVSDSEQSDRGELFWKRMVQVAFRNPKYKIYVIDFHKQSIIRYKTREEFTKILNGPNNPWGSTAYHKGLRLAISDFDFIQE